MFLCGLLLLAPAPRDSLAQNGPQPLQREYFVRQAANEALLIRINTFEAAFESSVRDPNGKLLLVSGLHDSHITPVFQFIDAAKTPRQLDIEVSAERFTNRSRFELELTRLTVWDERSARLARAYALLSFGMQVHNIDNAANWTVKINALMDAGRLFEQYGMRELALWSKYLATHLVLHRLHDHNIVLGMAREILSGLQATDFREIELATRQLLSTALIMARRAGSEGPRGADPDPVQTALRQTAELAAAMDYQYEMAAAIKASGEAFAAALMYDEALVQFELAVKLADSLGDGDLATASRESMVEIHARQGNAPASSKVLRQIQSQLAEGGGGDELALNLLQQGRLLIRAYQFRQAIDVLLQALAHQNNSAIRRQVDFALATAYYESGLDAAAEDALLAAGVAPGDGQNRRPDTGGELAQGLRMLAGIYRARGDEQRLRQARSAEANQDKPAAGRAEYLYELGLDQLARGSQGRQRALSFFRQSQQAAGPTATRHLALMQFCSQARAGDEGRDSCSESRVNTSYQALLSAAVPRQATEAMRLRAHLLVNQGRRGAALEVLHQLVDDIHLYRRMLPGVLGAWYWQRHEALFGFYLRTVVAAASGSGQGFSDGADSLLALSRIRHIVAADATGPDAGDTGTLRRQLAERADGAAGLQNTINTALGALRTRFTRTYGFLSAAGLTARLQSLADHEAVLTWHLTPADARVWVGSNRGVRLKQLPDAGDIHAELQTARARITVLAGPALAALLAGLGERLVAPLDGMLPQTLYWVPAGPLLGLPLDAFRTGDRYLAERHTVVNLASFPARPRDDLRMATLRPVFLAGYPRDYSSGFADHLDSPPEIRAVADVFVGPGLRIVQGRALLPDEFQDERFGQSRLVHLAMPGLIDLAQPWRSGLELSEAESGAGRLSLTPVDIRAFELQAGLLFMSATRFRGEPASDFDSRAPVVREFLAAGAGAVIAGLWPVGSTVSGEFISSFYRQLQTSGNIADALSGSKRRMLQRDPQAAMQDWAAYQLFVD